MTSEQVSSGLAAAFGAATLGGQSSSIALLITLFMAVTSSSSSELIAVSSILTFDVYKTYIKPRATPEQLIFVSHAMICFFGLVMAAFASIWNAIGISLGWLFLVMGLIIGGAVFPAAFTLCWKKQSKAGALSGSLVGLAAGLIAWLVEAKVHYGELTVETTGANFATLAGNLAAVLTGAIVSFVVSVIKPDDYDFGLMRQINNTTSAEPSPIATPSPPTSEEERTKKEAGTEVALGT
jgi:Na+/proline symporter